MSDNKNNAWVAPTLAVYGSVDDLTTGHWGETNKHLGGDDGFTFSSDAQPIGPGSNPFS